jgi:putative nucleotidyltransferase with HDIG domain
MDSGDIQKMKAKIEAVTALPTIPSNLKLIASILEKPRLTLDELARFVARDPALTTKVLTMVNSAAYGFPGRISSVSHAIMLLGLNVIRGLLLGVSVVDLMQKNMSGLWEHSCACAVAARCIAQQKKLKEPEEVSISALLHDIGKVIIMLQYHGEYEQILRNAQERNMLIHDTEQLFLPASHAEAGSWLAQKCRFPVNLVEAIEFHHRPQSAKRAPMETAIVHVADILVRARGIGFSGDDLVPQVQPGAWQLLRLSDQDIRDVLTQVEDSISLSGEAD